MEVSIRPIGSVYQIFARGPIDRQVVPQVSRRHVVVHFGSCKFWRAISEIPAVGIQDVAFQFGFAGGGRWRRRWCESASLSGNVLSSASWYGGGDRLSPFEYAHTAGCRRHGARFIRQSVAVAGHAGRSRDGVLLELVVAKEAHADGSTHFHVAVKLVSCMRFRRAKLTLQERHKLPSHWSCSQTQLWSALRYLHVATPEKPVALSKRKRQLGLIGIGGMQGWDGRRGRMRTKTRMMMRTRATTRTGRGWDRSLPPALPPPSLHAPFSLLLSVLPGYRSQ